MEDEFPEEALESLSNFHINESDFNIIQTIGKGGYGEVFLASNKKTGDLVALKKLLIDETDEQTLLYFKREVVVLANANNPFLLKFIGFKSTPPYLIATKYIPNGSLYDAIHHKNGILLTATQKTIIAMGIVHGMISLHDKGIIHRDLKSLNVLLDKQFLPKICDFGISRFAGSGTSFLTTQIGSPHWMAPEMFEVGDYSFKVDVYAFAILFWELLTGSVPFKGKTPAQVGIAVTRENKRPQIPFDTDISIRKFLAKAWSSDPNERPTFREIYDMFKAKKLLFSGTNVDEVDQFLEEFPEPPLPGNNTHPIQSDNDKDNISVLSTKSDISQKSNLILEDQIPEAGHGSLSADSLSDLEEEKIDLPSDYINNTVTENVFISELMETSQILLAKPKVNIFLIDDNRKSPHLRRRRKSRKESQSSPSIPITKSLPNIVPPLASSPWRNNKTKVVFGMPQNETCVTFMDKLKSIGEDKALKFFKDSESEISSLLPDDQTMILSLTITYVEENQNIIKPLLKSGFINNRIQRGFKAANFATIFSSMLMNSTKLQKHLLDEIFSFLNDENSMLQILRLLEHLVKSDNKSAIPILSTFIKKFDKFSTQPSYFKLMTIAVRKIVYSELSSEFVLSLIRMIGKQGAPVGTVIECYSSLEKLPLNINENEKINLTPIINHINGSYHIDSAIKIIERLPNPPISKRLITALFNACKTHKSAFPVICKIASNPKGGSLLLDNNHYFSHLSPEALTNIFISFLAQKELCLRLLNIEQLPTLFKIIIEKGNDTSVKKFVWFIRRLKIDIKLLRKLDNIGFVQSFIQRTFTGTSNSLLEAGVLLIDYFSRIGYVIGIRNSVPYLNNIIKYGKKLAQKCIITLLILSEFDDIKEDFRELNLVVSLMNMCCGKEYDKFRLMLIDKLSNDNVSD
ncbi:TKL family protein kinase [Histomonas meleagridis]|uniref:TKL family protein kinase n=1 Tax=Histomonas meleagridis TaxID=135588 RepID=UPI00355998BE|nr:TKL family protein kinase [Histomonas meleagridis]KAH0805491.1 TKL family protein kinase [Histomonas meleagridis]